MEEKPRKLYLGDDRIVRIMSVSDGVIDGIQFDNRIWIPKKQEPKTKMKIEPDSKLKVCTKCNQKKPVSEFYKQKNSKDGLMSWCKECHREYTNKSKKKKEAKKIIDKKKPQGIKISDGRFPLKSTTSVDRKTIKNWNEFKR